MSAGDPTKISAQPPPAAGQANDTERENTELEIGAGAGKLVLLEDLPEGKRPITKAERWFDTALYGGFMGVFNDGYSVWLADQVKEGKGKAFFDRTSDWLGQHVAPKFSSAPLEESIKRIKNFNVMLALMGGGLSLLIPMKWVENRKPGFVHWIQDHIIRPKDPERASKDEAALAQLDKTPILGWGPIITGRVVGTIPVFPFAYYGADFVHKVEDVAETLVSGTLRATTSAATQQKLLTPTARRYTRLATSEALYTGICTAGLYIYTHHINPPKHKGSDITEPENTIIDQFVKESPPSAPLPAAMEAKNSRLPQSSVQVDAFSSGQESAMAMQPQA